MPLDRARALLGLSAGCDEEATRRAFRSRLLDTHPDLNAAADATERTVRLTTAYQVVLRQLRSGDGGGHGATVPAPDPDRPRDAARTTETAHFRAAAQAVGDDGRGVTDAPGADQPSIVLVDAETIGITAPATDVVPMLVDAAHQLGDISYLDPATGLLEVIVEFVGAPTSSVVLTLQGRASGVTEVCCSVEPLSGGDAPGADAVTRLLLRTLRGEDPTA